MKENWYIMDECGNVVNEECGIADKYEAIENFKEYFENAENAEGYTLCKLLEDEKCWYECLEELKPDDIF